MLDVDFSLDLLDVGKLAARTGMGPSALRFYEREQSSRASTAKDCAANSNRTSSPR
jgi:DNA-binding transcriptional MerR regulator